MPPMRSGIPALNACESQPNPIRVSISCVPAPPNAHKKASGFESSLAGSTCSLMQIKLCQLNVARLCNLQINLRTVHHRYR